MVAVVALTACSGSPCNAPTPPSLAVPSDHPGHWPASTVFLATGRPFSDVAIDDGAQLLAVSLDEDLYAIPKSGAAPHRLAHFALPHYPAEALQLARTGNRVLALLRDQRVERRDPPAEDEADEHAPDFPEIVLVPQEGPTLTLSRLRDRNALVGPSSASAIAGIWFSHESADGEGASRFELRTPPGFGVARTVPVAEPIWGAAADAAGLVWLGVSREVWSLDAAATTPRSLTRLAPPSDVRRVYVALDARSVYVATPSSTKQGTLVAIDRASGAVRTLATELSPIGPIAVGVDAVCVSDGGAGDLGYPSSIVSVPLAGGPKTALATDLWNAHCLAADDVSFYVTSVCAGPKCGVGGIARLALP